MLFKSPDWPNSRGRLAPRSRRGFGLGSCNTPFVLVCQSEPSHSFFSTNFALVCFPGVPYLHRRILQKVCGRRVVNHQPWLWEFRRRMSTKDWRFKRIVIYLLLHTFDLASVHIFTWFSYRCYFEIHFQNHPIIYNQFPDLPASSSKCLMIRGHHKHAHNTSSVESRRDGKWHDLASWHPSHDLSSVIKIFSLFDLQRMSALRTSTWTDLLFYIFQAIPRLLSCSFLFSQVQFELLSRVGFRCPRFSVGTCIFQHRPMSSCITASVSDWLALPDPVPRENEILYDVGLRYLHVLFLAVTNHVKLT